MKHKNPRLAWDKIPVTDCKLTPEDRQLLRTLHKQLLLRDPRTIAACAKLLYAYYRDLDRAERTPRKLLYYHMGWLQAGVQWFATTMSDAGVMMVSMDEIKAVVDMATHLAGGGHETKH